MTTRPPTQVRVIDPRVHTCMYPTDTDVGAVTSLGDEVFAVFINNDQHIQVYNVGSFNIRRLSQSISVPALGCFSWGLAACGHFNCIYVSDWGNDCVHRLKLPGGHSAMRWSVSSRPAGLSLTSDHSLLVASQGEYKFQEFTTYGILLRNISIMENRGSQVMQAVQLSDDLFLFTHFGKPEAHAVCAMLASTGGIGARMLGGPRDSFQQLNRPAGLAVDKDGRVLVADWYNNRLLVLAVHKWTIPPQVTCLHTMSVSVDEGLKGPCSLWYDQARKRLCIGECEWNGHRVIVVDNLEDFSVSKV